MQSHLSPSAHVCTPPHERRYKQRNYGRVVAGDGQDHLAAAATTRLTLAERDQLLVRLAQRVAALNPESATIGGGMLRSLVDDARRALGQEGSAA